jgi:hypothetical protein
MLAHFYDHLASTVSNWPEHQHVTVQMAELTADLRHAVGRIYEQFGLNMSAEYQDRLEAAYERARSYQSTHTYTLEEHELDVRDIGEEFSHAFDNFGFERVAKA